MIMLFVLSLLWMSFISLVVLLWGVSEILTQEFSTPYWLNFEDVNTTLWK